MLSMGDQAMSEMINIVSQEEDSAIDLTQAQNLEGAINNYRKQLKGRNFLDVDAGAYSYQLGVYLMNVDQAGLVKNNDYEDKPLRR